MPRYGPDDVLFVGTERGSFVAVFGLDRHGWPEFSQWLPAPLGPEGLLPIPHRNLLVASGETDDPALRRALHGDDLRAEAAASPTYPQILLGQDDRRAADPLVGALGADRDPR